MPIDASVHVQLKFIIWFKRILFWHATDMYFTQALGCGHGVSVHIKGRWDSQLIHGLIGIIHVFSSLPLSLLLEWQMSETNVIVMCAKKMNKFYGSHSVFLVSFCISAICNSANIVWTIAGLSPILACTFPKYAGAFCASGIFTTKNLSICH